MKILILAVGRLRDKAIAALCEEYAGRIRRYGLQLSLEEVKEEAGNQDPSLILRKEAERLRSRLPEGAYTVALDSGGDCCDSPTFARRLNQLMLQGRNKVVFLVGGHLGLEPGLVSSCDWVLSLSQMTFSHEMVRLIFLEQLYRANTILRGEPYHK